MRKTCVLEVHPGPTPAGPDTSGTQMTARTRKALSASVPSCAYPSRGIRMNLLFTMSDNTRHRLHLRNARARNSSFLDGRQALDTRSWWSQTGSNRRPPACKAGALPTELWPHFKLNQCRVDRWSPTQQGRANDWWAREELNFRPHAYQACALTT